MRARAPYVFIPRSKPHSLTLKAPQFIKHITGQDDVVIGHSLKACTQDLRVLRMKHPDGSGRRLVLVDTQGFDDDQIGECLTTFKLLPLLIRF